MLTLYIYFLIMFQLNERVIHLLQIGKTGYIENDYINT